MESTPQPDFSFLEALYRELHAAPELSLHEEKTSKRIAEEFERLGLAVSRGVGGYGVAGLLKNGLGPTVLLRADMDALPLEEKTGLPYASRNGAMHACGHDLHMTSLVGTAGLLCRMKKEWRGTAFFIAQPAEEKGEGAQAMLRDGLFTRFPRPDYALALHVDSQLPSGMIGCQSGYAFANVDSVDMVIYGRGGHGAYPHLVIDPIVIASETVLALQTLVSREIKPYESAVVTVGSFHGGTKHNIIPGEVRLELTVRSYEGEVRKKLLDGIQRIATGVARAHGAPKDPEVCVSETIPSTYNDPALVARLLPVLEKTFGKDQVCEKPPEMGGEDFGLYGRAGVPAFLFRVGSVTPEKFAESRKTGGRPLVSLHSAEYAPDLRATLATGIRALASLALELLK